MALPSWITNIFTGAGSIDITSYAGSMRIIQAMLSIVLIGLSSNLINGNNNSLADFASEITAIINGTDSSLLANVTGTTTNTSLILKGLKSTSSLGLVTSAITALSHTSMSVMPYSFNRDGNTMISNTQLTSIDGLFGTLSTGEGVYSAGVSMTEISSLVLWGATAIYGTAKYGNWDCYDPVKLLQQYNQSSIDDDSLKLFNQLLSGSDTGPTSSSNSTFDDEWEDVYSLFNSSIYYTNANLSTVTAKQQLFIKLSQDCIAKKAAIGVSWVGVTTFVFTAALVAVSANRLSNGTTTDDTSTSSSSGSASVTTMKMDSQTPDTLEILSISADTAGGIPNVTSDKHTVRDMHNFTITNINTNASTNNLALYAYDFDIVSEEMKQVIHATLFLNSSTHPPQVSVDATMSGSSMGANFNVHQFEVDEVVGIYSTNPLNSTKETYKGVLNGLVKIVVFLTVESVDVRVVIDVVPVVDQKVAMTKDVEAGVVVKSETFRLKYSRAILFPMPIYNY